MASWTPELPDPNAGDDLAYAEAWENRIPDDGAKCACGEELDADGEHEGGYGAWCG